MLSDPLEKLAEMYESEVERNDAKGFVEIYKEATEKLLEDINNEFKRYPRSYNNIKEVHIEDLEYHNGYFIFGYGTNSVVQFHIKETPGWLYGIWWSPIETKDSTKENKQFCKNKIYCEFFVQYESEIDKFKPSYSMVQEEFNFFLDETVINLTPICQDIAFIMKEPYLAFYREMNYTDFNREHISRQKAKKYWDRFWDHRHTEEIVEKECTIKMFETLKSILKEDVEKGEAFIFDRGESWSPRYEIVVKNVLGDKPLAEEEGCYSLFDIYDDESTSLYEQTKKECKEISNKVLDHDWFFNPFPNTCEVRNEEIYNEVLEDCVEDKSLIYGLVDGKVIDDLGE